MKSIQEIGLQEPVGRPGSSAAAVTEPVVSTLGNVSLRSSLARGTQL